MKRGKAATRDQAIRLAAATRNALNRGHSMSCLAQAFNCEPVTIRSWLTGRCRMPEIKVEIRIRDLEALAERQCFFDNSFRPRALRSAVPRG